MKNKFNEQCITLSQMNLIFNMRMFWRRLTIWTRIYIISRYLGIGTAESAFERLYIENMDFGNMIRIHFNHDISNRYSQMLNQFSIGLQELVTARLAGDMNAVRQYLDQLLQNADERAAFLASINPYLDQAKWKNLLTTYLQYTLEEANLFASKDYRQNIEYFDRLMTLSNTMGDVFAEALYDYITSGAEDANTPSPQENQTCLTMDQINLLHDIRMFWFELIHWVRAFMLSRYVGIGDEDEVYARLKQVPTDYVNNLNRFFGETPGANELQLELEAYIGLIDSLITAQKAGDTDEVDRIVRLLYQNADDRAASVSSINPYWDQEVWKSRLYSNLRSTLDESRMFLTEDYARTMDIYSALLDQAESTGDYFTEGLVNYII